MTTQEASVSGSNSDLCDLMQLPQISEGRKSCWAGRKT